ncbi:MAG TPA: PQQ-binding-like beta-propeller repeat protein [Planctomycetaceae bacterium]|nr:PQQ-binding-like beta-propeller repeat protein [Planctomycetaceae bacterium]
MTSRRQFLGWGLSTAAVVGWPGLSSAADWSRFRGPNGSGVTTDTEPVPESWSADKNLKWKIALPGPGSSCPIIVGDKVFITCWSGYGTERRERGDQKNLKRHLICLDRKTGKTIWDKSVAAVLPEDEYGGMFAEHGYASHTPACDGERIYAFFGKTGAIAFNMDGGQLWQTGVGTGSDPRGWGSASSPVLYKNIVIITASAEGETLFGLEKDTGKIVWKQEAGGLGSTWGTPVLVPVDAQRTDLVLGVPNEIWGLNPETGKLRWYCPGLSTDSFCSSVVADGDVVFGVEGRGGGSLAVRAGGTDDVSETHVVWTGRDNNRIGTPVVHNGLLYFIANKVVNCVDAKTGERVYQSRLASSGAEAAAPERGGPPGGGRGFGGGRGGMGGQDYGSPIIADNKLYYVARNGEAFVVKLGRKFEQLSSNRVTADTEDFSATPAAANGALFIRSSKHLYCIAHAK